MKKIHSLSKALLFILLTGVTMASCSKNEKSPGADEADEILTGANHTFDITLVNKVDAVDVVEYAGEVPTDKGRAIYRNRTISGETDHSITMLLGELEEVGSIYGNFDLDADDQPYTALGPYHLQNGGTLTIRPEGTTDMYISTSGTTTFSGLKYALPTSVVGAACYTLNFEGDFEKYTDGKKTDDIFRGEGTFVISPQDDMGTYKAP